MQRVLDIQTPYMLSETQDFFFSSITAVALSWFLFLMIQYWVCFVSRNQTKVVHALKGFLTH